MNFCSKDQILTIIADMNYGMALNVPLEDICEYWPRHVPTLKELELDIKRTLAGEPSILPPEIQMKPSIDQFRAEFPGKLEVFEHPNKPHVSVSKYVVFCPRCRGGGTYLKPVHRPILEVNAGFIPGPDSCYEQVECNHDVREMRLEGFKCL